MNGKDEGVESTSLDKGNIVNKKKKFTAIAFMSSSSSSSSTSIQSLRLEIKGRENGK